jgi:SH3-like domain-containing protein
VRAALAIAAVAFPLAAAAEFRSIGEAAAVLYDAPSTRATKLYVASRNLPVEVISTDGAWVKVRDPLGGLSWIERKLLADKRTVMVAVPVTDVRQRAEERRRSSSRRSRASSWSRRDGRDRLGGCATRTARAASCASVRSGAVAPPARGLR